MNKKIRLLLPKGSLNTQGRGDTNALLKQAGYDIVGYEPGKESDKRLAIRNDPDIEVMLSRPQSAPNELILGMADLAIVGKDWISEENGNGSFITMCDLGYGNTRLVFAVPQSCESENLEDFVEENADSEIVCFSEYVNTPARALATTAAYKQRYAERAPMKQLRGTRVGDNDKVKIIMSDGVTEGYIRKGANLVFDNTQTGGTLKEYGLRELEEVARSEAGLYGSEKSLQDRWKREKADEIAAQLLGVVEAKKKDYVVFNIENNNLSWMLSYLERQNLFSDEPTLNKGARFSQLSILVPKGEWPKISKELKVYGASNIIRYSPQQVIG